MNSNIVTKKYINLYNDGLDEALRKMINVIEGSNVSMVEAVKQFQNITAYISDVDKDFRIEFRAESYTELQAPDIIMDLIFEKYLGKEDYLIIFEQNIPNNVPDTHRLHENELREILSRYNERHCKVSNTQFICLFIRVELKVINNEEESHGNKSRFLF